MIIPISHSYARDYRACPRRALYAHHMRYKPVGVQDARRDGDLIHGALEVYYRAIYAKQTQEQAVLSAGHWLMQQPDQPHRIAQASALIVGYAATYSDDTFEVLHIEEQFSAVIGDIEEQGRIDALVRLASKVYVLEHKTTSEDISDGSTYWARLHLDPQCSMYLQGARHLGYEPAGILYNVIRKPSLRPLKATPAEKRKYVTRGARKGELYSNQRADDETADEFAARLQSDIDSQPEAYYKRNIIRRTVDQESKARETLMQTAALIRYSREKNAWPQNSDSCGLYGRPCDYLPVCLGQASLENPALYYRKVN